MAIYSNSGIIAMSQDVKQLRVKIFDELSKIVDPEINTTITELELVDVDTQELQISFKICSARSCLEALIIGICCIPGAACLGSSLLLPAAPGSLTEVLGEPILSKKAF